MLRLSLVGSLGLVALFSLPAITLAAPNAKQRKELGEIQAALTKAGGLYTQKKYKEAGDSVRTAQESLEKLAESPDRDLRKLLVQLHANLKTAHTALEKEGVSLPALKDLPAPGAKPPAKTPDKPAPTDGKTSFVTNVAPILVGKCGRCHVNDMRGNFSMATFASFAKGSRNGVVFFKGDPEGSRIIEMIESGDMPRGGAKVSADELATLKKWLTEGAVFDGPDPQAQLTSLVPSAKVPETPSIAVTPATGKETVSFANDVAPVLAKTCTGCHGPTRPRNMFNLNTFTSLLKGGDSGPVISPGNPAESLLVQKLKGTASGQRMPLMQAPLATDVIAKIEKWIEEGARYDATDPDLDIGTVAALARANRLTHDELAADRVIKAGENWRLGMPGNKPNKVETKNFLLIGAQNEAKLAEFAKEAEGVVPQVAALFHAPSDQPMLKGRLTLFFFDKRYDYSEFGQMVEKRELPRESHGHWRNTIVDAYGAVLPPRDTDQYGADVLLAQQLAGAYVSSLGKNTPRWFSEGAGRAAAAKVNIADARVVEWGQQLPQIAGGMSKPDDFLTGKLSPEPSDICSYSFVKFLMTDAKRFNGLVDALKKGEDFNKAFAASYGRTPSQATALWLPVAMKKPPPVRKPAGK